MKVAVRDESARGEDKEDNLRKRMEIFACWLRRIVMMLTDLPTGLNLQVVI